MRHASLSHLPAKIRHGWSRRGEETCVLKLFASKDEALLVGRGGMHPDVRNPLAYAKQWYQSMSVNETIWV
jgi:hypothetical protein